ncbi:ARM repeat-containing protein [Meredithblackwellia eburnea MCA 4105]
MYQSPTPPPPGQKPSLQGVRNKQRKGAVKASAKFEPQAFRDQLTKHLESVAPGDFDAVASKLDVLGNQLDYHKYEQQLFEILLVGALLAPGGGFIDDGAPKSTFSVISSAKEPVEVADIKKIVEVFNKLMRRYKYLQKPFEETALKGILQYANKFSAIEQEKLAVATALFISAGLVGAGVINVLKKDHLIKDSVSITFLVNFCKAFIQAESLDQLATALRKGAVTNLESFLPASKQTQTEFSNVFKAAGLNGVVEFYTKQKSGQAKEETVARLKELVAEDADHDEIQSYLEQQHQRGALPDTEFIAIVWNGLLTTSDLATKTVDQVVKDINGFAPILETFSTKPATEVALINTIQIFCYENTKLMPAFPKILKNLYSADVVSDQAIIYWHGKGSKPQGRATFLASSQPLVTFLQEQEDEESDEE